MSLGFSKLRLLFIMLFTFMLLFIFTLSTQDATQSSNLSIAVTEVLLSPAVANAAEVAKLTHHSIRDLAHIGLFALLGLITMIGFILDHLPPIRSSLYTLGLVLICALMDECIQLFSDGRAFQLSDIAKDLFGASLSIVLVLVCRYIYITFVKASGYTPSS